MHSKTLVAIVAALAGFLPTAIAGSAKIDNQCSDDVYLWSIADSAHVEMKKLGSGESYSEKYRENGNGGGISMKLSLDESQKEVSQFEYTLSKPKVFYDLSNIDGYPFKDGGVSIIPSNSECPKVICSAGDGKCAEAYNKPDDDHATKGCPDSTDLHVILCGGKKGAKLKVKKPVARHPHARPSE
ncbi:hypothetical protein LOZ12_000717 [Ophidiomyces ophidiicola]|nr:hypothetical protein LOZ62_001655 [Ophidiomyces ophidiicola]KAI2033068.1 hypothetical protein LOZ45_000928 [Ophidiomyces ophidiicola]KAI2056553.1 hypothetical protein LOZ38_000033 [Ophidiomyces ophidiicola]KAI2060479.1 hypothetical protein LOZ44_000101 [Ophidiomyces ophidiicola]KAI2081395.1 hypothetical protein LOZ37_001206 [Ophidiomyces ophidiicola]